MLGKALARTEDIVVQESGNELLIYDLKINKAYCLNETSALVWQLCDGKNTVSEISDKISAQLRTLASEDLVWLALDQFNKDGLLEDGEMVVSHFAGVSRREIVKKIGFVSVVALPIVSSIIVPTGANAQSCLPPGAFLATLPPGACVGVGGPPVNNVACCSGFSITVGSPMGPCQVECQ